MNRGFTFIEILITLAVIAICFLPLMQMFSASLEQVYTSSDLTTGRYLAQEGMERLKNLGLTQAQIEAAGDVLEPPSGEPALDVNGKNWRVARKVLRGTDPLEVRIQVFQDKEPKHIVEITSLLEDLDWTPLE